MAITLKLSKSEDATPWGFRLVGGLEFDQPIVVVKVNADSLAESAGLEVGDIIVRINDTSTAGLTHNEVHDLLLSAGLEFELGIRRGEITTRIITDEDYDVEESNAIRKVIEEDVLNEAITIINNMKNSIDSSREKSTHIITENLAGQEEIINTVTFQSTSAVKKGSKWSTFLIKPDKPIPNPKKKVQEKPKDEPYRVVIKKQTRRPSQEKRVQFDQNVTELEVDFEDDETHETTHEDTRQLETVEVKLKASENEEITIEETDSNYDYEAEATEEEIQRECSDTGSLRDSVEIDRERLESFKSVEDMEIKPSLEEQLLAVQKQLQALSQLPSAIQVTLDAVSKQLANIVGARESAERNGEHTSSSKDEEEPQTEEEFLEDTSVSEKAEAELLREDSDGNSSIAEDLEEDQIQDQEERDVEGEEVEDVEELEPSPYAGLTEEEREAQIKKEELEAKRQKVNHWNNVWPWSDKVKPVYRESNCWKVPSRAVATKHINFLKYQPPPKNLDYLQRSEVYRLVHDMEPPVRGITSRAEKVLAEQDYYAATMEAP
ncbi:uncharacterized protein LOC108905998 isoform X2 [Anoplophora glabripennis]|uniref:uncharacterized protein LOC108905998 isoform X2 n=1 Tax=Anoplophora glabripennis TaxID=217634 RepID=UPI000C78DBE8|nr:uncharacterized protein LOC108905998 isoform X2 [Anoplophora glabripennis]